MPKSPIRIGLEHQPDGSVRAWGLDFPGCLAEAPDDTEAVLRFAQDWTSGISLVASGFMRCLRASTAWGAHSVGRRTLGRLH